MSRSKERMTTLVSAFKGRLAFSRGSWASASLRILTSICCSSPGFQEKSKERVSAGWVSETPTKTRVPGENAGAAPARTVPWGEGAGWAADGVGDGSGFSGARFLSTGRSGSSGGGEETGWLEGWSGVEDATGVGEGDAPDAP